MLSMNPAYPVAFLFQLRISALFNGLWISIPVPYSSNGLP